MNFSNGYQFKKSIKFYFLTYFYFYCECYKILLYSLYNKRVIEARKKEEEKIEKKERNREINCHITNKIKEIYKFI